MASTGGNPTGTGRGRCGRGGWRRLRAQDSHTSSPGIPHPAQSGGTTSPTNVRANRVTDGANDERVATEGDTAFGDTSSAGTVDLAMAPT